MAHLMIHFTFLNFKTIFLDLILLSYQYWEFYLGFLGLYFQLRDARYGFLSFLSDPFFCQTSVVYYK